MAFTLPDLPYPYDALVPQMSRETPAVDRDIAEATAVRRQLDHRGVALVAGQADDNTAEHVAIAI